MVENRRLLIALASVLLLGVVARFALTSVRTYDGVYYAKVPDDLPSFEARKVYICPKCTSEFKQAYRDLVKHEAVGDRLEKYRQFYAQPGENGCCPVHPDQEMTATTEIPVHPQVNATLPIDTEYVNRAYYPKNRVLSPYPTSIDCTIVISSSDRRSIHRAESCLTAQGWSPRRDPYHVSIQIGDDPDETLTARSLMMWNELSTEHGEKVRAHLAVLYWYAALPDRVTSSEYRRLGLMFYDRLIRGLNYRWCYVLISKRFQPGISEDAIREELEQFVAEFAEFAETGQATD